MSPSAGDRAAGITNVSTVPRPETSRRVLPAERVLAGTLLGFASALGYTMANVCLRRLADCDPIWVSCVKALPTAVCAGPLVIRSALRGERLFANWRSLAAIAGAATLAQLFGNVLFQWALGVVGLAMAVPITLGTIIIGSTILGRLLGETVTLRTILSIALILSAIVLLSMGAPDAYRSVRATLSDASSLSGDARIWLGILALSAAGIAYSVLGASIRWSSAQGTPVASLLLVASLVGLGELGTLTYVRHGWTDLASTTSEQWVVMLLAGTFNALAFFSLAVGMHWSGLVRVNLLNGSQTAMSALIGVLFFKEAFTLWLGLGVSLTVAGLVLLRRNR